MSGKAGTRPQYRGLVMPYSGGRWLVASLGHRDAPAVSPLGFAVAEVLGYAFRGIYHVPDSALFHRRTVWNAPDSSSVKIVLPGQLATDDGDELTRLVAACGALGLRMALRGAAPNYMRASFARMGEKYAGVMPFVDATPAILYPSACVVSPPFPSLSLPVSDPPSDD